MPSANTHIPEGLIKLIADDSESYRRVACIQEWLYWTGSASAAICSAIAGLSIAAEIGKSYAWGNVIAAGLAVVPAVWTAAERSLRLRRMSLFNYSIAASMSALQVDAQYIPNITQEVVAKRYSTLIGEEHEKFIDVFSEERDERVSERRPESASDKSNKTPGQNNETE